MYRNQKRFVEDELDLLNEVDEGLRQLEANPQASAPLEQVIRTMHTIKGRASMFCLFWFMVRQTFANSIEGNY